MNQILSQEEVDALLQGVTEGDIETQGLEETEGGEGVVPYDLTSQERIIRGRMPTLEIIHQRFSRLFRSAISAMLRRVVDVAIQSRRPAIVMSFEPTPKEFFLGDSAPARLMRFREKYEALARSTAGVTFMGRLGTYRYLDMDVTIAEALSVGRAALEAFRDGQAPESLYAGGA